MSAGSGRIIRTIIAQENCPAMPHGCWYATAWAVHAAAGKPAQSACDVIERCFQEQYASKCLPGEEETF